MKPDLFRSRSPAIAPGSHSKHKAHSSVMPSYIKTPGMEPSHTSLPSDGLCWDCVAPSVPGKLLCVECMRDVAKDKKVEALRFKDYFNEAVAESMHLVSSVSGSKCEPKLKSRPDQRQKSSVVLEVTSGIWDQHSQPLEKGKEIFSKLQEAGSLFSIYGRNPQIN